MTNDRRPPFFDRTDWLSFWAASGTTLAVYLFTLTPDISLESEGAFSTASFYGGIGPPPGYPLWALYSWLFTEMLSWSNVAWRVAVSSAVAGAGVCGLIALMVSRGGAGTDAGGNDFYRKPLRLVCGWVVATGFGFSLFWSEAVVADENTFSALLFTLTLCVLLRWMAQPARRRYFYPACFLYGMCLTQSQILFSASPGLVLLVLFGDKKLGRDLLWVCSFIFFTGLLLKWARVWNRLDNEPGWPNALLWIYLFVGGVLVSAAVVITVIARRFFTEWRAVIGCVLFFLLGLSPYLLLPIVSMTNPPVNWSYARTVEGFFHLVERGQYERLNPAADWPRIGGILKLYFQKTFGEFGVFYSMPVLWSFFFFFRSAARRWLWGLMPVFLSLTMLIAIVLNESPDRQTTALSSPYYIYSYIVLMIWAGQGLMVLGRWLAKPESGAEKNPA